MFTKALPDAVVNRAKQLGPQGQDWLDKLDGLAEQLLSHYQLSAIGVLHGGTESLVVEVEDQNTTPLILKIGLPGSADLGREARVYELASGQGYATLTAYEPNANALILEKLGSPLEHQHRDPEDEIKILCDCMAKSWLPLTANEASEWGLISGAEKAQWHIDFLTERANDQSNVCPMRTIELALSYATSRKHAHSPDSAVLIHGDAHSLNTLLDKEGTYKFIDPDGLFAERACDLSIPMREYNEHLLDGDVKLNAQRRCERLSKATNVEPQGIWEWGFVERVSTAFVLADVGMHEESEATFAVANQINSQVHW